MFIRRTQTRNRISGEPYVTYRLVQASRVGKSVKQATVLNLGSHFDLPQAHWASLAQRIDELVSGQASMLDAALPEQVQAFAQRFAAQIIARKPAVPSLGSSAPVRAKTPAAAAANNPSSSPISPAGEVARYQEVDLDSLELVDPRSVGVEQAALSAMRQCGLEDKLKQLGLNRPQIAAALGNIVGRMAQPGSELATHAWLGDTSALGELIDCDFQAIDLNRLYRASDLLYKHRDALQEHLFGKARSMFGLGQTITLYDLTNTYFEGVAAGVSKAKSIVLFGNNGVGKTMVALNIVHQAVLQGHTALCTTAGLMLSELAALDSDSGLRRRLQHYSAPDLLLIDEVGYLSYSNRHADMLFELVSRRYLHKSTIVTTNKRFADWGEVFPNAACVVSLVDRLMHRAEVIRIEGESYRAKEAEERDAQRRAERAAKTAATRSRRSAK